MFESIILKRLDDIQQAPISKDAYVEIKQEEVDVPAQPALSALVYCERGCHQVPRQPEHGYKILNSWKPFI